MLHAKCLFYKAGRGAAKTQFGPIKTQFQRNLTIELAFEMREGRRRYGLCCVFNSVKNGTFAGFQVLHPSLAH